MFRTTTISRTIFATLYLLCAGVAVGMVDVDKPITVKPGGLVEIVSDASPSATVDWVVVEPAECDHRIYSDGRVFVTTGISKTGLIRVLELAYDSVVGGKPTLTKTWHEFRCGPPPSPEPVVLPTATLKAEPSAVKSGESTTLTWATTGSDKVTLDTGDGPKDVDVNGSAVVLPRLPTNLYTLAVTATDRDTTVYAQAVVSIGEKPPPIVPSKVDRVTYVWEKDKTAVPRPVAAALNKINADSGGKIIASELEVDTKNGQGQNPPAQYKIAHAAAVAAGLPCLVAQAGDTVIRVIKDPKTLEAVLEASK